MASCRLLPAMPAEQGGRPSRDDSTSSKDAEPGRGDRSKIFRVTVIVIKWCQVLVKRRGSYSIVIWKTIQRLQRHLSQPGHAGKEILLNSTEHQKSDTGIQ